MFFNARLSTKFSHHRFLSFCKHNLMNLQVQALPNVVSGELEIFNFFFTKLSFFSTEIVSAQSCRLNCVILAFSYSLSNPH